MERAMQDLGEERVVIRAPAGTTLAIERAAKAARLLPSAFVRLALLEALDSNGIVVQDRSSLLQAEVR